MGAGTPEARFFRFAFFFFFGCILVLFLFVRFGIVTGNPNMVMALAGNKADLEDKRKVTAEVSTTFSVNFSCNYLGE